MFLSADTFYRIVIDYGFTIMPRVIRYNWKTHVDVVLYQHRPVGLIIAKREGKKLHRDYYLFDL